MDIAWSNKRIGYDAAFAVHRPVVKKKTFIACVIVLALLVGALGFYLTRKQN